MKTTAIASLVSGLLDRGLTWVATLCGHGLDPFFHAARQAGLRLIDTRNEQTAAYMADAYGRLTGKPGVCAVSSGVAVANALAGVVNAHLDQAPMLLISGSAALPTLGMGAFQDLDQVDLARPVTKFSRCIDTPGRVLQVLDEAWERALEPPAGPVHIMLPMDVQKSELDERDLVRPNTAPLRAGVSERGLELAAERMKEASRPLIIAGSGLFYSGEGADLFAFAEEFRIPVQTPIWDRGVFDRDSECFLGVIGAASGGPGLLAQSDCVVLAGAASDYRVGYLQSATQVHSLAYGWRQVRQRYIDLGGAAHNQWLAEARRQRAEFRAQVEAAGRQQSVGGGTHSSHIVGALGQVLPEDSVVLIDGGSIGQWAHQLLCDRRYPSHWLTCGRSGVVGWGIGGAMAARLAYPERAVVLLSGDGAFTFNAADLECAVRQRLPFVAIVADDQSWGITQTGHLRQFGEAISTQLGPVRFDLLAESLGARGVRIGEPRAIVAELDAALRRPEVTVLHVPTVGGNPS